jgi:hypothetical protein
MRRRKRDFGTRKRLEAAEVIWRIGYELSVSTDSLLVSHRL